MQTLKSKGSRSRKALLRSSSFFTSSVQGGTWKKTGEHYVVQTQYLLHSNFCTPDPSNCDRQHASPNGHTKTAHTWKSTLATSWKPSSTLGSLYLDAKPVKATFGSMGRFSGFVYRPVSIGAPLDISCVPPFLHHYVNMTCSYNPPDLMLVPGCSAAQS